VLPLYTAKALPWAEAIPFQTARFLGEVPENIPPGVRLYWRARVYDFYEDGQWLSTVENANPYDPQRTNLRTPIYNGRWLGSFKFTAASSIASLFTPAIPLW